MHVALQIYCICDLASIQPTEWTCKNLDGFLKREQGLKLKNQKLYKQFKDQKGMDVMEWNSTVASYRTKVNSKSFTIPIVTASTLMFDMIVGMANAIELTFTL